MKNTPEAKTFTRIPLTGLGYSYILFYICVFIQFNRTYHT